MQLANAGKQHASGPLIRFGSIELADRHEGPTTVDETARLPQFVVSPTRGGQGEPQIGERFVNPADRNEDMGASQENPCAGEPSGQVQGGVKGGQCGSGLVCLGLRYAQGRKHVAAPIRVTGSARGPGGSPEFNDRTMGVSGVPQHDADGLSCVRDETEVAWMSVEQPDRGCPGFEWLRECEGEQCLQLVLGGRVVLRPLQTKGLGIRDRGHQRVPLSEREATQWT